MTTKDAINCESVTFIDVRESYELDADGKLEKAKHIPMAEIPNKLEEIKLFSTPIVVFCKAGSRAGKTVEFLQENGFTDVYNGGGYDNVSDILND